MTPFCGRFSDARVSSHSCPVAPHCISSPSSLNLSSVWREIAGVGDRATSSGECLQFDQHSPRRNYLDKSNRPEVLEGFDGRPDSVRILDGRLYCYRLRRVSGLHSLNSCTRPIAPKPRRISSPEVAPPRRTPSQRRSTVKFVAISAGACIPSRAFLTDKTRLAKIVGYRPNLLLRGRMSIRLWCMAQIVLRRSTITNRSRCHFFSTGMTAI
jgi:hypothetical protein